jgi:predicted MFS family arabinose efflux permease
VSERRVVVLAGGAFVVATDATLVVGLLPQMAKTMAVSPPAAGQAVTVYAACYAAGAPVVIRAARRARPERLLAGALGVFAGANAATGAAPSLLALLAARAAAGVCAGVFMACAATAAARSVRPRRRGRALATVVGGASLATAFGVPLGTFAGAVAGWRAVFWGMAVATALAATASWLSPQPPGQPLPARPSAPRGEVVVTLAGTLAWATGSFTVFTYLATVLRHIAAVGPAGVAGFLLLFGAAGLVGAAASGWLTDHKGPFVALAGGLALTALSLGGLGLTAAFAPRPALAASIAAVTGYGVGTWAVTPVQQQRLLASGGDDRLLLSLNASALYLGVAFGGAAGGLTLALSHRLSVLCWVAASIEAAALALIAPRRMTRPPARRNYRRWTV